MSGSLFGEESVLGLALVVQAGERDSGPADRLACGLLQVSRDTSSSPRTVYLSEGGGAEDEL